MVATSGRGWHLAPCLVALIEESDRLFPSRSIASDGSIGDQAHASRDSDHNPANGWVCAVDVTDDKAHGCNADLLARHIVACRDPRVKYVIWNRTIAKSYPNRGLPAWTPQPYTGVNAHEKHTHVSVHNTPAARGDTSPWWPTDEELDMADVQKILDRLDAIELRVIALEQKADAIAGRQVPEATVRADIVLNRRIAAAVGVTDDQIPGDR